MILRRMVNSTRMNWHLMLYPTLWAYRTSVKTATGFSPFQLIHRVEAVFLIECEVPSLKIAVELLPDMTQLEERLVYLEHLDEQCRDAALENEAHKKCVKSQYDKSVHPRVFSRETLCWSMTRTRIPWGQESLTLCGMTLMSCDGF
jgi:hypothetical protein